MNGYRRQQEVCKNFWHTGRRLCASLKRDSQYGHTVWGRTINCAIQEGHQDGSQRPNGSFFMRTTARFEKVQFKSVEETKSGSVQNGQWSLSVKHYKAAERTGHLVQSRLTELQQRWQPVSPSPQMPYRRQIARRRTKKERETPKTQRYI